MSYARHSRPNGPLTRWAGDSAWRRFAVWLLRNAIALLVLLVGVLVILNVLVPNMINGVIRVMTNQ